ncbi:MAG: helix-turn-helix transcriptional regulator [Phycisphaerales bacterium]|jgi:AraC-like DNA-binding protein|nr:helix-turn-helix transcriptional regulator [Phycisphaerales bacterium]
MSKSHIASFWSLGQARENNIHLSEDFPIAVKHVTVTDPMQEDPPSYHPYFEVAMWLRGTGDTNIASRSVPQRPYDIFISGSSQPHWGTGGTYPKEAIVVYFLPNILCDWGSPDESLTILDRFSAEQPIERHIVRPDAALRKHLVAAFRQMTIEFDSFRFGRRLKLQTMLISLLVDLIRWEIKKGLFVKTTCAKHEDWAQVILAIRYMRDHFSQGIYAADIANAAGVISESRLRELFRETLKMPWTQYLQSYRIHRAILLLKEPNRNITEIAYESGFESLSHFNRTFKSVTGASPSQYLRQAAKKAKK